eukprot:1475214-Rhodomonas_salina.1
MEVVCLALMQIASLSKIGTQSETTIYSVFMTIHCWAATTGCKSSHRLPVSGPPRAGPPRLALRLQVHVVTAPRCQLACCCHGLSVTCLALTATGSCPHAC